MKQQITVYQRNKDIPIEIHVNGKQQALQAHDNFIRANELAGIFNAIGAGLQTVDIGARHFPNTLSKRFHEGQTFTTLVEPRSADAPVFTLVVNHQPARHYEQDYALYVRGKTGSGRTITRDRKLSSVFCANESRTVLPELLIMASAHLPDDIRPQLEYCYEPAAPKKGSKKKAVSTKGFKTLDLSSHGPDAIHALCSQAKKAIPTAYAMDF
ncbi:MAG: hypothetical protein GC136_03275 [Alphaproteobacteria bacterium]|nr:hypothetical protein [Alphaproteobacteria bacterium]